jgi:carbon-monoxide dehydrogenase small subunit
MRVTLAVNGDRCHLDLDPGRTLADVISTECGATGGHRGCADGTCGACTVLVDGEPTRACLMLAVQCGGARVLTVEGVPDDHPLRAVVAADELIDHSRCLPGLVTLAAGAIDHDPGLAAEPERLHRLLTSNVCRRPGHETIEQAVIHAAAEAGRSGPR